MPGRVFLWGETYHIAFSYKGVEYRKSAQTNKKREAERLLVFYLGQCARGEFKGFVREDVYTLFEMLDDFIADYEQRGMRDVKITQYRAKNLRSFFKDVPVEDVTERKIDLYIKHRLTLGRSRTTVNRELQLLGQAMRLAERKKLLTDIPHIEKFSEKDNARQGFFEREEFEAIVALLPEYLKDVVCFAYHTGWRKTEILTLGWQDVHGDVIRLKPAIAKNKDGRIMVGEVANIIARRQADRVESCPFVFHRNGIRIKHYNPRLAHGTYKAGLPGKIVHDARRTAVRNMDRAGVPRQTAKQITGHKTDAVYNRYRIVNEQDIREGMMQVQNYLAAQNLGTSTENVPSITY